MLRPYSRYRFPRSQWQNPTSRFWLWLAVAALLLLPLGWWLLVYVPDGTYQLALSHGVGWKDALELHNQRVTTGAQILLGLVVLVGAGLTFRRVRALEKQAEAAHQGQLTERFTRAIDQLGSKEPAICLGGIYGLERIAQDSEQDHPQVLEVLCAFVREETQAEHKPDSDCENVEPPPLSNTVHTALQVIARNPLDRRGFVLNLAGIRAPGAQLQGGSFVRADLRDSNLTRANLVEANLKSTTLGGANLEGANLERANLMRAGLERANLMRAGLDFANLDRATLSGANLERASLEGTKLGRAILYWANLKAVGLIEANLEGAKLVEANLEGTIVEGANLRGANLRGANLEGAILDGANLEGAILEGAILDGVDLRGARGVAPELEENNRKDEH